MRLDFVDDPEDLSDLGVERDLSAEEDVAVGVGSVVAVLDQCRVTADLPLSQPMSLRNRSTLLSFTRQNVNGELASMSSLSRSLLHPTIAIAKSLGTENFWNVN